MKQKDLKKLLVKLINFQKKKTIKFKEFIFIDDGSSDQSYSMIKNFIEKKKKSKYFELKLYKLNKNLGKGAAIQLGVKKSKKNWILTSDIDFQFH